jgi:hypothetical protein
MTVTGEKIWQSTSRVYEVQYPDRIPNRCAAIQTVGTGSVGVWKPRLAQLSYLSWWQCS